MANPLAKITAIVQNVLCDSSIEITSRTQFDDLPDWDEMDLIAVVVEVECQFALQFEVYEIDRLTSVVDLVNAVIVKQALAAV